MNANSHPRLDQVLRIAAFDDAGQGGNPAGVWIGETLPPAAEMQALAHALGVSETAFATREGEGWRERYFSRPAPHALVDQALALFGYTRADLDPRIPPALAHGGADHLVLALASRARLAAMAYALQAGRAFMLEHGLVTVVLAWAASAQLFHTRNPFASGGVYEDAATGAGTAALAGYLRDLGWPHGGYIDVLQGEDMGMRSRLRAEFGPEPGGSIRVSGSARMM